MASQVKNGKAFEWAMGLAIRNKTGFVIEMNAVSENNRNCFNDNEITDKQRDLYNRNAHHAAEHILEKEMLSGVGEIIFLADDAGKKGDVRDLKIRTKTKIVGVSCKTNHDAYKHSRLSKKLDFVKKWGLDPSGCSEQYFNTISPLFDELAIMRKESNRQALWADQADVPARFYWPLLNAFENEVARIQSPEMCEQFIQYLVGKYDFYKVVSKNKGVTIQGFNLQGTLNVAKPQLPTKIDLIKDKNSSQYSKTILFNKGWTFNFRIHSASSRVEASLKFDVQAVSLSPKIYTHHIDF